ncbi:MAG TPA: hypothetical protein VN442_26255 [Bryobacteraceae bacterium]|nr:hypothetical protein [Bryobacteraceae bacterium]
MESFRFTLFNNLTMFVMATTLGMVLARAKTRTAATWPMFYWLIVVGFALAFKYSLSLYLVAAGVLLAMLVRFTRRPQPARIAEFGVLAYVFTRCLELLLLW